MRAGGGGRAGKGETETQGEEEGEAEGRRARERKGLGGCQRSRVPSQEGGHGDPCAHCQPCWVCATVPDGSRATRKCSLITSYVAGHVLELGTQPGINAHTSLPRGTIQGDISEDSAH